MTKDPRLFLVHVLEAGDRIRRYTERGREAFFADTQIQDAVIRNFEVIGEAAKRIPEPFRTSALGIPWRALAGFRDILIHQYEGVSLEQVWSAVEKDLDPLLTSIRGVLPPPEQLQRELESSG